jgi:hypothetical protein
MEKVDRIHLAGDWDKLWAVLEAVERLWFHKMGGIYLIVVTYLGALAKNAKNDC